jgi:hypothetical protein
MLNSRRGSAEKQTMKCLIADEGIQPTSVLFLYSSMYVLVSKVEEIFKYAGNQLNCFLSTSISILFFWA